MVLFGSKARGDSERDSDIDVAILVHGMTAEVKRRILDIVAEIELDRLLPLSTLVLSSEEFARLKSHELRVDLDIEHEGHEVEFDEISKRVVGCAIEIHRALGPRLPESTYD
jgi:predicted nucleotidyltransferase